MSNRVYVFIFFLFGLVITFFILIICSAIFGNKLFSYLKKNNYQKWKELTTIGSIGPGFSNPIKGYRYLLNKDGIEDTNILRYKDNIKIIIRYIILDVGAIVTDILLLIFIR